MKGIFANYIYIKMLKVIKQSTEPITKKPKIKPFKQVLTYVNKSHMSKKLKNITIPVTDLASLCGMDHYNNWSKSICKLWKQIYPDDFKKCSEFVNNNNIACVTDSTYMKIKKLEQSTGTKSRIASQVYQINQRRDKSTSVLRKSQTKVEADIMKCNKMNDKQKYEMIKLMSSATNVVYGTRNENIGIKEFETRTGKTITSSQNKMVHPWAEDTLLNGDKIQWVVTGKFDGLTTENELVEIKNRQRCLFNTIRDYEKCQIQVYLNILDLEKGYLVEVIHNNEQPDVNILETRKDSSYIELNILPYLMNVRQYVLDIPFMTDSDKYKLLSGEINSI